jgi:hypothetical protein
MVIDSYQPMVTMLLRWVSVCGTHQRDVTERKYNMLGDIFFFGLGLAAKYAWDKWGQHIVLGK